MTFVREYLQILFIAAFVLSGISPACAFISGKSWAEICGADGSVKTVKVDPDLLPYLPDDGPKQDKPQAKNQCGFCFASSNITQFFVAQSDVISPTRAHYLKSGSGTYVPSGQNLKPYDSQGPPIFV